MDFSLSNTEKLFLQMIRSFAENEVKPLAAEVDEQERFPMETVEKMRKIGLFGIPVPKEYGDPGSIGNMIRAMETDEGEPNWCRPLASVKENARKDI